LTRRLLTSISSLPTGAAHPRVVLKTVILFVPNMAARPRRTVWSKALRLACWNADGVRGRKLELEHFLSQHGVDICLLSQTFLNAGQVFRLANMSATAQTDSEGRYSYPSPPWYSPPLTARSGPDPLGRHCCSSHLGRQTGENPSGLPLTFPLTDRRGPDRLFGRGITGFYGRRPQRQTRGMELAAEYEKGNSYMITPTRTPV
jgi:hypothetical protein